MTLYLSKHNQFQIVHPIHISYLIFPTSGYYLVCTYVTMVPLCVHCLQRMWTTYKWISGGTGRSVKPHAVQIILTASSFQVSWLFLSPSPSLSLPPSLSLSSSPLSLSVWEGGVSICIKEYLEVGICLSILIFTVFIVRTQSMNRSIGQRAAEHGGCGFNYTCALWSPQIFIPRVLCVITICEYLTLPLPPSREHPSVQCV